MRSICNRHTSRSSNDEPGDIVCSGRLISSGQHLGRLLQHSVGDSAEVGKAYLQHPAVERGARGLELSEPGITLRH